MPYNFLADSIQTRNFVADFLHAKCHFTQKTAVFRFSACLWKLRSNVQCWS